MKNSTLQRSAKLAKICQGIPFRITAAQSKYTLMLPLGLDQLFSRHVSAMIPSATITATTRARKQEGDWPDVG